MTAQTFTTDTGPVQGTVVSYAVGYSDEGGASAEHRFTPAQRTDAIDMLYRLTGTPYAGFPDDAALDFDGWFDLTVAQYGMHAHGYGDTTGNTHVWFAVLVATSDVEVEAAWIAAVRTGSAMPDMPAGYVWGEHDAVTGEAHLFTPDGRDLTEQAWARPIGPVCLACGDATCTAPDAHHRVTGAPRTTPAMWTPAPLPVRHTEHRTASTSALRARDAWSADPDRTTRRGWTADPTTCLHPGLPDRSRYTACPDCGTYPKPLTPNPAPPTPKEPTMGTEHNPTVWADGYGRWHASVPLDAVVTTAQEASKMYARLAYRARKMIRAELDARGVSPAYVLKVAREQITGHGTVIFGEVWA